MNIQTMAVADSVKLSLEACMLMSFLYWIKPFLGFEFGWGVSGGAYFWTFTLVMLHQPLLLRVICVNSVKVTLPGEVDVTERRGRASLNSWLYYGGQLACTTGAL